jgi:RNA polymerase sigma-70 factor (ECF subfamily)
MSDVPSFRDLIRRVRDSDQAAATELVRRYGPALQRAIRFRLLHAGLGPVLDSLDVCQSVLGSFFVRATTGQYELEQPGQLLKLLVAMARHKLASQERKERADRRDRRRVTASSLDEDRFVAADPSPSQRLAARELLEDIRRRLSVEEQRLMQLREEGRDWAAIAAELGGSAVALRKKLSRAFERVHRELGEENPHV